MSTEVDIIDRLGRSLKPFWHHTRNDVIGDAMAEITNLRGSVKLLLSKQQELFEEILKLAKNSAVPAEMVASFEEQCHKSRAAIDALSRNQRAAPGTRSPENGGEK